MLVGNDHAAIKAEEDNYKPIPVIAKVTEEDIQENYLRIKQDITDLFKKELALLNVKEVLEEAENEPKTNALKENDKFEDDGITKDQYISMQQ